jgi:6-phosphogluconolactonase
LQAGSDTRNDHRDDSRGFKTMIEAEWWDYESVDELADAVAGDVCFIIESAVDARNASLVALPGGDAAAVYAKLAGQKLPWKRVTIVPTDDLLVPVDDERSKVRGIAREFLPTGARVVPIVSGGAEDYRLAGNAADARLQDLPWPPDLVWLGVGDDGHTASIFPGPDLQAALDAPKARRAVGVMPEGDSVARVTLTRASILSARTILITLMGAQKRDLLEQAIADGQSSKVPIGRVLAEVEQPIDIHWCP